MSDTDQNPTLPPSVRTAQARLTSEPARVRAEIAGLSHPGRLRANNEDRFLVIRTGRSLEWLTHNLGAESAQERYEESGYILLVADGVGGRRAGEVASSLALQLASNLTLEHGRWDLRLELGGGELERRALGVLEAVDRELSLRSASDPELRGMLTTLTTVVSFGRSLLLLHVGDSRAYLVRGSLLQRLTRDQTLAQMLVDVGAITAEEAARHPRRNVLTSAVGHGDGGMQPQLGWWRLEDGDVLLLCSDGLSEEVDDATIHRTLLAEPEPERACAALVELALANGGRDNITAVVARYHVQPGADGAEECGSDDDTRP